MTVSTGCNPAACIFGCCADDGSGTQVCCADPAFFGSCDPSFCFFLE